MPSRLTALTAPEHSRQHSPRFAAGQVIRHLHAAGVPANEVVHIMRRVAAALAVEHTAAHQPAAALRRLVAAFIRAGHADTSILHVLGTFGVQGDAARQLTAAARSTWAQQQVRLQRRRWTRLVRTGTVLSLLITCMFGGRQLAAHWQSARATPAGQPVVVVDAGLLTRAPVQPNAMVISDRVNARMGPDRTYPVLQELTANTPLHIIGWVAHEDRYLVKLADDQAGWVRTDPAGVLLAVPRDSLPLLRLTP